MRRPEQGDGAMDVDHWDDAINGDTDPSWAARSLATARATYPGSLPPAEPDREQPEDDETEDGETAGDTTTD